MTATIINFPTLAERDALEFDRFGTSSYTRAFEEAAVLVPAMRASQRPSVYKARAGHLTNLIQRLAIGRPGAACDSVLLDSGEEIELLRIPSLLAAMLAAQPGLVAQIA